MASTPLVGVPLSLTVIRKYFPGNVPAHFTAGYSSLVENEADPEFQKRRPPYNADYKTLKSAMK